MSVPMASAQQLEKWKEMGGKVQEAPASKKGAKAKESVFVSPGGGQGNADSQILALKFVPMQASYAHHAPPPPRPSTTQASSSRAGTTLPS
jgi:hypothetical protein